MNTNHASKIINFNEFRDGDIRTIQSNVHTVKSDMTTPPVSKFSLVNDTMKRHLINSISSDHEIYTASSSEENNYMDNKSTNDILLKYIDNLDKKYDDYKKDMIESEKRIYNNTKDAEERYEKRQAEDNKLYQERQLEFEKRLDDRFKNIENTFNSIDSKFDRLENKIDSKFKSMENEIKENNKYLKSLTITTILGIAAMVISIVAIAISMYFSLLPVLSNINPK